MTGWTVRVKLSLWVAIPSFTITVIRVLPDIFVAGVTLTVRVMPLPPNVMLLIGTRLAFEDKAVRVKLPAGVSTSPIVKAIGPAGASSFVV